MTFSECQNGECQKNCYKLNTGYNDNKKAVVLIANNSFGGRTYV